MHTERLHRLLRTKLSEPSTYRPRELDGSRHLDENIPHHERHELISACHRSYDYQ
jgi:hypothetical protein